MTTVDPEVLEDVTTYFPSVFVNEIVKCLEDMLEGHHVVPRPLRSEDPGFTVGVWAEEWVPDEDSYQIGQQEATIARYVIRVQNSVKAAEESIGRALFSLNAKAVRVILYRDPELAVRLRSLQEQVLGSTERVTRFKVTRQRYMTARLNGFLFIATTDLTIETTTTTL